MIASSEVDDFAMKIKIDADSTFEDLHNLIIQACGYIDFGVHRFYVCDEDWHPEHRILQTDAGYSADEDIYLMSDSATIAKAVARTGIATRRAEQASTR